MVKICQMASWQRSPIKHKNRLLSTLRLEIPRSIKFANDYLPRGWPVITSLPRSTAGYVVGGTFMHMSKGKRVVLAATSVISLVCFHLRILHYISHLPDARELPHIRAALARLPRHAAKALTESILDVHRSHKPRSHIWQLLMHEQVRR
ncbi:hypothetical protein A0H81_01698 [Grifola frondosa]|uniref:Uncharacterized protein n=1 Tax=Grifola frondosa TaxID=5627 RepID=A0A1C7MRW3_GRIFR|nr:hypothetical protein A0H81_01698 [Grifola frondosa]